MKVLQPIIYNYIYLLKVENQNIAAGQRLASCHYLHLTSTTLKTG